MGVAVGLALSLTGTGSPLFAAEALRSWGFAAAALIGAAALAGGIAALWHRHRPGEVPWWGGPVAALLFAGAVELTYTFTAAGSVGGVTEIRLMLTGQPWWALLTAHGVVAVLAWRAATGVRLRLLLIAATVSVFVVLPRLAMADSVTVENATDHIVFDGLVASGAGLAVFLGCAVIGGRAGVAVGAAGAWLAALLTALALTLAFAHPTAMAWYSVRQAVLTLAPALLLVAGISAVAVGRRRA
ncbi:hypothetical protein ACFVYA_12875 [Amycolatopsis sp. NPDC058278]|uniref:hypothetical protein n=1 Tax=Amycolatopsis sp. NPDC058278 TaxID=3346417 RepID=UPI0036D868F5